MKNAPRRKQLGFWGAVIGGALSYLGSRESNKQSQQNTAMSYEQSRMLRQTAYQDTTEDLKTAGLNPMLAYQNSATPTPQMPVAQNRNEMEGVANSAASIAQLQNLDAQNELLRAQAAKALAEAEAVPTSTANIAQQTKNLEATLPKIEQEIKNLKMQNMTEEERVALTRQQTRLSQIEQDYKKGQITYLEAQTRTQNVLTQLRKLEVPGAKNIAEFEEMLSTGSGSAAKLGETAGKATRGLSHILNSARKAFGK